MLLDGFQGQPVVQVSVGPGGYHTIALCSNGSVWTWGHNRVGQVRASAHTHTLRLPPPVLNST